MSWDDVGNALVAGVKRAAKLPDDRVIWKHQNYNAPPHSYVTLSFPSMQEKGQDWVETTTDLNRPRGEEIEIRVKGIREVALELEYFTDQNVVAKRESAMAALDALTSAFKLPGVRFLFSQQQISPFDVGRINWVPDVPGINFRGRAVCTVRCYLPAPSVAEYVGYIERVIGEIRTAGSSGADDVRSFDTIVAQEVSPGTEDDEEEVIFLSLTLSPISFTGHFFGDSQRFVATAVTSTGDVYDASLLCSWSSSDELVVVVDGTGLVVVTAAFPPGSAIITATYQGMTATAVITVN